MQASRKKTGTEKTPTMYFRMSLSVDDAIVENIHQQTKPFNNFLHNSSQENKHCALWVGCAHGKILCLFSLKEKHGNQASNASSLDGSVERFGRFAELLIGIKSKHVSGFCPPKTLF